MVFLYKADTQKREVQDSCISLIGKIGRKLALCLMAQSKCSLLDKCQMVSSIAWLGMLAFCQGTQLMLTLWISKTE